MAQEPVRARGVALLLVFLWPQALAGAAGNPLAPEIAEMKARGFKASKTISETIGEIPISAILFHGQNGYDQLNVYATLGGKALMLHTRAAAGERLEFDEALGEKRFPDFLKDGSRVLVYRASWPALNQSTLYVLRYAGLRFKRIGVFPEGRIADLDGDGRYEIVTRRPPLGRFVFVGCREAFQTLAREAYQTDVQAWRDGRFASVAPRFPAFYAERIARSEESLKAMGVARANHPGDYLGLALTLYYDYTSKGERRRGWERFLELCRAPAHAPPGVGECLLKIKNDLRARLSIPDDWP